MMMRGVQSALLVALVCGLLLETTIAGNPDAKRLYDDLLSNYNKLVRPVVNTTDVLRVCIKLKLSQLIDVVSFFLLQLFDGATFMKNAECSWLGSSLSVFEGMAIFSLKRCDRLNKIRR